MAITPAEAAILSTNDLEYLWLQAKTGLTPQQGSVQDMRRTLYNSNEFDYWATLSGLTPKTFFSLADHKLKAMQLDTGSTSIYLTDVERLFYIKGTTKQWVETARNRHLFPIPTLSGWSNNAGTGGVATPTIENVGPGGSAVYVMTMTTAPTGGAPRIHTYNATFPISPVTPGESLPVSVDVSSNHAGLIKLTLEAYNGGTFIGSFGPAAASVSNTPGSPTRITYTMPVPANTTRIGMYLAYPNFADAAVGAVLRVGRPLVGATGAYFDGSTTSPDPTLIRYRWLLGVNNSISVREDYV